MARCLYNSDFATFLYTDSASIYRILDDNYHGEALTTDWATIVCLVGGGQEINTGEAGISEWIHALNDKFPHWKVYISPKLTEPEYAEGKVNELLAKNENVTYSENLHLGVSLRSFRAEKLSAFVHSMLTFNTDAAEWNLSIFKEFRN